MIAQAGFESSFRDITDVAVPTTILTFRAHGDELLALAHSGMPFYKPPWSPTIVGMVIDEHTDWGEVADLVTESYRVCAPQRLARLLDETADETQTSTDEPPGPIAQPAHSRRRPATRSIDAVTTPRPSSSGSTPSDAGGAAGSSPHVGTWPPAAG